MTKEILDQLLREAGIQISSAGAFRARNIQFGQVSMTQYGTGTRQSVCRDLEIKDCL